MRSTRGVVGRGSAAIIASSAFSRAAIVGRQSVPRIRDLRRGAAGLREPLLCILIPGLGLCEAMQELRCFGRVCGLFKQRGGGGEAGERLARDEHHAAEECQRGGCVIILQLHFGEAEEGRLFEIAHFHLVRVDELQHTAGRGVVAFFTQSVGGVAQLFERQRLAIFSQLRGQEELVRAARRAFPAQRRSHR